MKSAKRMGGFFAIALALALSACGGSAHSDNPDEGFESNARDAGDADDATEDARSRDPDNEEPDADAAPDGAEDAATDAVDMPPPPPGDPIEIAPDQLGTWVWVPVDGMVCGDGSPSGVGVNFTDKSRDLVIWFQGNGVCYDHKSCLMFRDLLTGMGPEPLARMWWGDTAQGQRGIFNRNNASNPFRDSNFVVLPHCTVDAHTADKKSKHAGIPPLPEYHQHGYANATKALERILPTFLDASRITVAGFSAGAIGATANYHKIATAFEAYGHPPPFLIADAGPLQRKPFLSDTAQKAVQNGWGLKDTIGTFCPRCITEGIHAIYETIAELHPGVRSSVICSYNDVTAFMLYRMLNYDINIIDNTKFEKGLKDLSGWIEGYQAKVSPSAHRDFFYGGDRHGAMVLDFAQSPGLLGFIEDQLSGDPSWSSIRP